MSELEIAKREDLRKEFLKASLQYPDLRCVAVTNRGRNAGSALTPDGYGNNSQGLSREVWRSLLQKKPVAPLVPITTRWLNFDGELWESAFYNGGGSGKDPLIQLSHLKEGIEQFAQLAEIANGAGRVLDWAIQLYQMPSVKAKEEVHGDLVVRLVPQNLFAASADALVILGDQIELPRQNGPDSDLPKIKVDEKASKAWCNEVEYSLPKGEQVRMLQVLIDAKGEWVAMEEKDFTKASRVKDSLPEPLKELIETKKGKGYRFKRIL